MGFGIRDSGFEITGAREGLAPDKVLGEPERRAQLAHLIPGSYFIYIDIYIYIFIYTHG